jgi:hypothetical protein
MSQRPSSAAKFFRSIGSLLGGILLEVVFILWFMLIILGVASLAMFIFGSVG